MNREFTREAVRAFHKLLDNLLATSRISNNFFRFGQLSAF